MGDMSIAQLWWGTLAAAAAVCVCALCVCVCCDSRGQLLPAPLPWCFPTEKGRISERARGVLENETRDDCWQRPWKCMTTNAFMPVSDSAISTWSDLIFILSVLTEMIGGTCRTDESTVGIFAGAWVCKWYMWVHPCHTPAISSNAPFWPASSGI